MLYVFDSVKELARSHLFVNQATNWMTRWSFCMFLCAAYEDISIDRLFLPFLCCIYCATFISGEIFIFLWWWFIIKL